MKKREKQRGRVFGLRCLELLARYHPNSHSLRMCQCSLFGVEQESLAILPKQALMQNGKLYRQEAIKIPRLERGTIEQESGLWHTPTTTASPGYEKRYPGGKKRKHPIPNLPAEVQEGVPYSVSSKLRKEKIMFPTPTTAEADKIPAKANYGQIGLNNHPLIRGYPKRPKAKKSKKGEKMFPTPQASDHITKRTSKSWKAKGGVNFCLSNPEVQEKWKMFPTPTTDNGHERSDEYWKNREGKHQIDLQGAVKMFPTPSKGMYKQDVNDDGDYAERVKKAGHQVMLPSAVKLYPTPRASDGMRDKMKMETHLKMSKREDGGWQTLHTQVAKVENATTGQLHSKWVSWLMGYPLDWLELEKDSTRLSEPWDEEPRGLPRVTTGEKDRIPKLKGLGNAIVPTCAVVVMNKIKELLDD